LSRPPVCSKKAYELLIAKKESGSRPRLCASRIEIGVGHGAVRVGRAVFAVVPPEDDGETIHSVIPEPGDGREDEFLIASPLSRLSVGTRRTTGSPPQNAHRGARRRIGIAEGAGQFSERAPRRGAQAPGFRCRANAFVTEGDGRFVRRRECRRICCDNDVPVARNRRLVQRGGSFLRARTRPLSGIWLRSVVNLERTARASAAFARISATVGPEAITSSGSPITSNDQRDKRPCHAAAPRQIASLDLGKCLRTQSIVDGGTGGHQEASDDLLVGPANAGNRGGAKTRCLRLEGARCPSLLPKARESIARFRATRRRPLLSAR